MAFAPPQPPPSGTRNHGRRLDTTHHCCRMSITARRFSVRTVAPPASSSAFSSLCPTSVGRGFARHCSGQRAYGEYLTAAEQAIQYGHSANKVGHTEEALQHFQKAHQMQVSLVYPTLWNKLRYKRMRRLSPDSSPHPACLVRGPGNPRFPFPTTTPTR